MHKTDGIMDTIAISYLVVIEFESHLQLFILTSTVFHAPSTCILWHATKYSTTGSYPIWKLQSSYHFLSEVMYSLNSI